MSHYGSNCSSQKWLNQHCRNADELGVQPVFTALQRFSTALALAIFFTGFTTAARADQPLPFLDTGVQIYSNVTVMSKSATHVFIRHSKGLSGLKVAELSQDALVKLGYQEAPKEQPKSLTTTAAGRSNEVAAASSTSFGKFTESFKAFSRIRQGQVPPPKFTHQDDGSIQVD